MLHIKHIYSHYEDMQNGRLYHLSPFWMRACEQENLPWVAAMWRGVLLSLLWTDGGRDSRGKWLGCVQRYIEVTVCEADSAESDTVMLESLEWTDTILDPLVDHMHTHTFFLSSLQPQGVTPTPFLFHMALHLEAVGALYQFPSLLPKCYQHCHFNSLLDTGQHTPW